MVGVGRRQGFVIGSATIVNFLCPLLGAAQIGRILRCIPLSLQINALSLPRGGLCHPQRLNASGLYNKGLRGVL